MADAPAYDDAVRGLPVSAAERPLALIGFMGIGKTTVGRELAKRLRWQMVDTDRSIETQSNMTIREIFDWFGEARFRELEREVITAESVKDKVVLSLGGGAFVQAVNREVLLERCTVVYLAAPWSHMAHSIQRLKNTRPLLHGRQMEELRQLFESRHPCYDAAHVRVSVPGRNPSQVATRILELVSYL